MGLTPMSPPDTAAALTPVSLQDWSEGLTQDPAGTG